MKICLLIIFNHKYVCNIEKLKYYYKNRFTNIYFLIPFYKGNDESVIGVYESSYQFQGYIAQGFNRFFNEKYTYYLIIGDDLLLNPAINENNICDYFSLKENDGYIHSLTKLSDMSYWEYKRFQQADRVFKECGVKYKDEIPSIEKAKLSAGKYGFDKFTIKRVKKYSNQGNLRSNIKAWLSNNFTAMNISYPLVAGYSDIIIVPKDSIIEFCHLSGVFAAMNLFVEIAIPTTMMLTCKNIVMSDQIPLRAEKMWDQTYNYLIDTLDRDTGKKMGKIADNFPKEFAYLHPIKLSKWTL